MQGARLHALCRDVLGIYVRALLAFQRRCARRGRLRSGQSGCVTVIQRSRTTEEIPVGLERKRHNGPLSEALASLLPPDTVGVIENGWQEILID